MSVSHFEAISNDVLNGSLDLSVAKAECDKLAELLTQVGETREVSKAKQIESAIDNLNNLKKTLGSDADSKPLDDAIKTYTAKLDALKKQVVPAKKPVAAKTDAWKQQVGKKQVSEEKVILQKGVYGLGNGIDILYYPVENDGDAPDGVICMRKNGSLFVIINHKLLEIPQCTFNVRGDNDSDEYTIYGTKFYNEDLDDGKQDTSKYASVRHPEGDANHAPHHVNKEGVNRVTRRQKKLSQHAAAAEKNGLMSSAMIDIFSALNIGAYQGNKK